MSLNDVTVILDTDLFQDRSLLSTNSYFGGRSYLPSTIEWPRNGLGSPLSFIAQIDLSEVAGSLAVSGLSTGFEFPAKGYLFFFVDTTSEQLWNNDQDAVKVIYHSGALPDEEVPFPEDMKSLFEPYALMSGSLSDFNLYNVIPPGRRLIGHPKVNLSFKSFRSESVNRMRSGDHKDNSHTRISLKEKYPSKYSGQYFHPSMGFTFLRDIERLSNHEKEHDWYIDDSYPWCWLLIEKTCQTLYTNISKLAVEKEKRGKLRSKYDEGLLYCWGDLASEATGWIERAGHHNIFSLVDEKTSREFKAWIRGFIFRLNDPIFELRGKQDYRWFDHFLPWIKYPSNRSRADNLFLLILDKLGAGEYIKMRQSAGFICNLRLQEDLCKALRSVWPYLLEKSDLSDLEQETVDLMNLRLCSEPFFKQEPNFQLFGNAHEVQDLGDLPERKILLFQVPSSYHLNLMIGDVGVLQVWITQEDLEQGNFNNIQFTADCH